MRKNNKKKGKFFCWLLYSLWEEFLINLNLFDEKFFSYLRMKENLLTVYSWLWMLLFTLTLSFMAKILSFYSSTTFLLLWKIFSWGDFFLKNFEKWWRENLIKKRRKNSFPELNLRFFHFLYFDMNSFCIGKIKWKTRTRRSFYGFFNKKVVILIFQLFSNFICGWNWRLFRMKLISFLHRKNKVRIINFYTKLFIIFL